MTVGKIFARGDILGRGEFLATKDFVGTLAPTTAAIQDRMLALREVDAAATLEASRQLLKLQKNESIGLRTLKGTFCASDPLIAANALRQQVTSTLAAQNPGKQIAWLQSGGLMEVGMGYNYAAPLAPIHGLPGGGIGVATGFITSTLMTYRALTPEVCDTLEGASQKLNNRAFKMPANANDARNMVVGSEFEVMGQGLAHGDVGFAFRGGDKIAPVVAGIQLLITLDTTARKEYSLKVVAQDGKDHVRVVARDLGLVSGSHSEKLFFGPVLPPNSLITNVWAAGALKYWAEKHDQHNFENFINYYTCVIAYYGQKMQEQKTGIQSYDFDLSKPEAREAYNQLMRLSFVDANKLAETPGSGVTKFAVTEDSDLHISTAGVTAVGQKLIALEMAKAANSGGVREATGPLTTFKDTQYERKFSVILRSDTDILWQAMRYKDAPTTPETLYYHFNFKRTDAFFSQANVDSFFRFAQLLNTRVKGTPTSQLGPSNFVHRLFTKESTVKVNADIYFTPEGVRRIDQAGYDVAFNAYLAAAAHLDPTYTGLPANHAAAAVKLRARTLMLELKSAKTNHWAGSPVRKAEVDALRAKYMAMFGRELSVDEALCKKADKFAKRIAALASVHDKNAFADFFTDLGKSQGNDYMQVISTLALIAGDGNTLVHGLSAHGNGVSLDVADEGVVSNPRDAGVAAIDSGLPITTAALGTAPVIATATEPALPRTHV